MNQEKNRKQYAVLSAIAMVILMVVAVGMVEQNLIGSDNERETNDDTETNDGLSVSDGETNDDTETNDGLSVSDGETNDDK